MTLDEIIESINPLNIVGLDLVPDKKEGVPLLIVTEEVEGELQFYRLPATKTDEIIAINTLLRSFDLGITIEFMNYRQYTSLLETVMHLLNINKAMEKVKPASSVHVSEVYSVLMDELSFKYKASGIQDYMDNLEGYISEAIDLVLSMRKATA